MWSLNLPGRLGGDVIKINYITPPSETLRNVFCDITLGPVRTSRSANGSHRIGSGRGDVVRASTPTRRVGSSGSGSPGGADVCKLERSAATCSWLLVAFHVGLSPASCSWRSASVCPRHPARGVPRRSVPGIRPGDGVERRGPDTSSDVLPRRVPPTRTVPPASRDGTIRFSRSLADPSQLLFAEPADIRA
jgi:hypothetical protein